MHSIDDLQQMIETALQDLEFREQEPQELYAPMAYILEGGGKRMRPLLCLLAAQSIDPTATEDALPGALAVELLHNFTLVHDDIMDNAPQRRGRDTLHVRWGEATAILAGDALFAEAFRQSARCELRAPLGVTTYFAETALRICEGQAKDMHYTDARTVVPVEQYLGMIRRKTAALIGASIKLGAMVAGGSRQELDALEEYGLQLGLAFQVQDDYLDTYADESGFGKQPGGDIMENKATFLWLKALEKASVEQRDELWGWFKMPSPDPTQKFQAIKRVYDELNMPEEAQAAIQDLHRQAEDALQRSGLDERALPLRNFLDQIAERSI